jgi:uncharacterized protein YecT (DUF1311 family)
MRALAAACALVVSTAAHAWPAQCPAGSEQAKKPMVWDDSDGCKPITKYYDALWSAKPDWEEVHRCAAAARNAPVLMMLYANGYGVPRDYDRAIEHACAFDAAPAETAARVEHLLRMKGGEATKPFDLCDDITSGMMGGFCASIAEDRRGRGRNGAFAAVEATLAPAQRPLFAALRRAGATYAEHVGRDENDLSGTARAQISIDATAQVMDELEADLKAAQSGQFPSGDAKTFAAADAALNDVYRKVMALPADDQGRLRMTTVTKAGIRTTQRAWLAYRDAWTKFATARYPSVPADAWKTRLTERRTALLRGWLR